MREAAVHAGADGVAAVAEAQAAARRLHQPCQRDILEQVTADRGMAADRVVSRPRDQQILSVGGSDRRGRIVHLLGRIGGRELGEDHRHDCFLPEAVNLLLRGIREQCRPIFFGFCNCARQRSGFVYRIGIGKQQPFSLGLARTHRHGIVLAGPVRRERPRIYHSCFSE